YAVVTWSGGCGAVQKSDWSVLKDRDVTIWPDNDKPGINAAQKITAILNTQGNQAVKTVDLSADLHLTLPHKWDLADKMPDGVDIKKILAGRVYLAIEKNNHVGKIPVSEKQQRMESIKNYLNAEMDPKNNPWVKERTASLLKSQLEFDPTKALRTWQTITNDYNFKPLSFAEMQDKIAQASTMLTNQKVHIPEKTYDKLLQTINSDPQAVIQKCEKNAMLQIEKHREADILKFTDLSKQYSQLSPSYFERGGKQGQEIVNQLKELSDRYAKDEKFNQAIEKNNVSAQVQQSLLETKKLEMHRGFER
ncbi:MAG: hypothetical protein WCN27_04065, partial [Alphaproteobacteria bacterium]